MVAISIYCCQSAGMCWASNPEFGWNVQTDNTTHTKSMKNLITHTMNFSRDSRVDFPRKSANGLQEQGQEIGMEFLWQRLMCFKFSANAK